VKLDANGYYALIAPLCVAIGAWEWWVARRAGARVYRFAETIGNLSGGLGEVTIGLFLGPVLIALYDQAYAHAALFHWRESSPVPWLLAFFAGDLCYYGYHRASHKVAVLYAIHGVHHQAEELNVGVALRNPWFSDVYSAIFYAPMPLLGVSSGKFFLAISAISLYAVTVHSRFLKRPGFGVLVTPQSHIVHHAFNKPYRARNYGAMFQLWDRLFGTHVTVDPAIPPSIGSGFGYESHDGAWSQLVFFRTLWRIAAQTPRLSDKLKVFVKPPGWLPPGASLERHAPARAESAIPPRVRAFALAQFASITVLALWVLWLRDSHPWPVRIAAGALVLSGTWTIGAMLDGREGAARIELLRLFAAFACGILLAPAYPIAGPALASISLVSALALAPVAEVRGRRDAERSPTGSGGAPPAAAARPGA
jgi:sterol desaturase/sphingolipid hydroxylase (fatty acid hydroxylase superfamily)